MKSDVITSQIDALGKAYAQQLPKIISQIDDLWEELCLQKWDKEKFQKMYRIVHNLAGSGGTFGFQAISEIAHRFTNFTKSLIQDKAPSRDQISYITEALQSLKKATGESKDQSTMKILNKITTKTLSMQEMELEDGSFSMPDFDEPLFFSTIFVLRNGGSIDSEFCSKIIDLGYEVKSFNLLIDLKLELEKTTPCAIVMDLQLCEENFENRHVVREIQKMEIPMLFISNQAALTTQFQTVRAGGQACLTYPFHTKELQERLYHLSNPDMLYPPRIMIVDDDMALATHYSLLLRKTGMLVEVVTDPMRTIKVMQEFNPDLLLLDMYMPDCDCIKIINTIRKQKNLQNIPILFLSVESDIEKQFNAIKNGADDFLQKPIRPNKLISSVHQWIQRVQSDQDKHLSYDQEQKIITHLKEEQQMRKIAQNVILDLETQVESLQKEVEYFRQMGEYHSLPPGSTLNSGEGESYDIQQVLSRGGMGITYLALRHSDQKKVVVKTLLPEYMNDTMSTMRFLQEGRILMQLDHENLVKGYDIFQGKNLCFLVMEFIEGKSVDTILEEQKILDSLTATKIILHVARGLSYLEKKHLLHRDIKPENIIINKKGIAILVDFGIVKMTNHNCSLTTKGIILGTPQYVSPEQLCSRELDIRSDIYSLGATYYHMVVGEEPFDGESEMQVLQQRLVKSLKPRSVKSDLFKPVANIIEKMTHRIIRKRYQKCEYLIADLQSALQKLKVERK